MPEPRKGETKQDFLDRCMGDAEANDSFPEADQRFAFCNSQWRRGGGKGLPRRIK